MLRRINSGVRVTQHPQLRDLIWAVCSPPLLKALPDWPQVFDVGVTDELRHRLVRTNTEALEDHIRRRETRFLGKYFEALWEFFFLHEPRFDVCAKNLQIRDSERTLGEFDFVVFDHATEKYLQLELAVKFYLGVRETNGHRYTDGEHLWIGPQARDRLDIKVARALEHQLTLHQHPQARQQLGDLGINAVEPQILFRGYLFQPEQPLPLPEYVVPGESLAQWLKLADLERVVADESPCYVLHKRHWLAPPYADNLGAPLTVAELQSRLHALIGTENRPVMFVQGSSEPIGAELKRYFVTPDHWPVDRPKRAKRPGEKQPSERRWA